MIIYNFTFYSYLFFSALAIVSLELYFDYFVYSTYDVTTHVGEVIWQIARSYLYFHRMSYKEYMIY